MSAPPPGASLFKTTLRGAAWLGLLNGLGGLLVLALNAWLNRSLADAPLQMGLWMSVFSLLLFAAMVAEAGLSTAIVQRPDMPMSRVAAVALLELLAGALGALVLYLIAEPFARLDRDADPARLADLVRMIAPVVLIIAAGLPQKALLQRSLRFRAVATIESTATLVFVVASIPLTLRMGIEGLAIATLLRHSHETILYWTLGDLGFGTLLSGASFKGLRQTLAFGGSMAGQGVLGTAVRQADTFLVMALLGSVAVGIYRQLQTFVALPFSKLLIYVNRAAFPTFARAQGDRALVLEGAQQLQRAAALGILPALAGLAAIAPRLLAAYLGPQYAPHLDQAVDVMRLLCVGGAAFTLAYSLGVLVNAVGAAHRMLARQGLHAMAVFGLMAVGSLWGFAGLAAGRAVAGYVTLALFVGLAAKVIGFDGRATWRAVREALPASLVMGAVVVAAGWAADALLPASRVGGTGAWPVVVLAAQVVVGVAAYAAALRAFGIRPRRALAALRAPA